MATIVVLEALDGVGKSTTAKALTDKLISMGKKVVLAREPGFTDVGEKIRTELLLSHIPLTQLSQFCLFQVARLEMLEKLYVENKDFDYIVLDRFWPSTLAYQVSGGGVPMPLFLAMQTEVDKLVARIGTEIDIGLLVPEEVRQQRLAKAGKGDDRYESKPKDFVERVCESYKRMIANKVLRPVNADAPMEVVVRRIIDILEH